MGTAVFGQGAVLGPIPLAHHGRAEGELHLLDGRLAEFQIPQGNAPVGRQVREMQVHILRKGRGSGRFRDQQLRGFVHGQGRRRLLGGDVHAPGVAARADGPGGGRRGDGVEGVRGRRGRGVEGGLERGRLPVRGTRDGGRLGLPVVQGKQDIAVMLGPQGLVHAVHGLRESGARAGGSGMEPDGFPGSRVRDFLFGIAAAGERRQGDEGRERKSEYPFHRVPKNRRPTDRPCPGRYCHLRTGGSSAPGAYRPRARSEPHSLVYRCS